MPKAEQTGDYGGEKLREESKMGAKPGSRPNGLQCCQLL